MAGNRSLAFPDRGSCEKGIHDVNGNGKTDIGQDGGAMSNNPGISILNLGKPSYKKTAFSVGAGVTAISVNMKYF